MKAKNFDEIVTARADERAQNKINVFKKEIRAACINLLGGKYVSNYSALHEEETVRKVLLKIASGTPVAWPREIWEIEENLVREELLDTMDEMQKALIAASRLTPGENIKEEPSETP